MKKISTLCLVLLSALASWAYDFKSGDLYYNITSKVAPYTVEVTYTQYMSMSSENYPGLTTATIPASVTFSGTTYNVTGIKRYAFYGCSSLTSVTIPNSVKTIGEEAFASCKSLTSIVVDADNVGYDSRENCNAIIKTATNELIAGCQNTIIPNSVTRIGLGAFYGCRSLVSIAIPDGVKSIGREAFYNCKSLTSITIPKGVRSIESRTFYYCSSLSSVAIPNSVTSIGDLAFAECSALTTITIPSYVQSIDDEAFAGCSSLVDFHVNAKTPPALGSFAVFPSHLKTVYIPTSTLATYEATRWAEHFSTFIEEDCLELIDPTWQILYTSTDGNIVTPYRSGVFGANIVSNEYKDGQGVITFDARPVTSIGYEAFYGCTSLTSITIPNSVTSIGGSAFSGCASLTSITIPNSVTSIGNGAFYSCQTLKSVTLSSGVRGIGSNAFAFCTSLTSITIPESVKSIGGYAFDGCTSLTSITVPNSVTSIGGGAFTDCTSLTSITIPNSVTSIEYDTFDECSSLTSITIPNSVTSIGIGAFSYCSSLPSITIPNSVTSIGAAAFEHCSSLTSVTLGSGVTSIGERAFENCTSLTSITCKATTPPTLGSSVFPSELTTAYVPCGTKSAYEASDWAKYVSEFVEEDCAETEENDTKYTITYTSTDGKAVTLYKTDGFGANIVSNEYKDGQGVITFDAPVTSIGEKAFYERKSLASITIPNSVTTIGKWAFDYCSSLSSVTIPNSITSIGLNAFGDCGNLTATHYKGDIADWCEIQFGTYDANPVHHSNNLYINGVAITDLVIPAAVERIGDYAFQTCTSLKSITISEGVKHIGMSAFAGCQISSITIPESIESIGNFAFHACSSLSSVTLGSGVKSIGSVAFADCTSLTSITIPESVTSIGESAFSGCDKLKTVYVKAITPPRLGGDAFKDAPIAVCHILCGTKAAYEQSDWAKYVTEFVDEGCSSIEQITYTTMNDSVVAFNTASDFGAYYVKNEYKDGKGIIYFNTPITKIGAAAFSSCGSLTSITLPEGVVSIEEGAFNACTQLKSVVIPSTVVSIGNNAFNSCHALTSVVLPKNIKTIGESAFANCQNLMAITLPNGLTNLGGSAFMGCVTLQSVELPNTLASIGAQTFLGCSSLRTITIPASIKTIGWLAFSGCRGLRSITCESKTPAELEDYAFYDVPKSIPVYIPCASLENYEKAAGWKEFTNLTEPEPEITELHATACDTYTWNGKTYTASTKESVVLTTAEGCDSIVVLNLTINYSVEAEMTVDTCDTYTWNGQTYTTSGDYTYTTTAQNGCDSTITLHLTIYPSYHVDTVAIACDKFEWYGNTYTASGDYTYTTTTQNGCDSIVTLHLTVNKSTIGAPQLDTICYGETFTWNGQDYTATGEYQQILTNAAGCDSLATLKLLVLPQMITQEEKVAVCPSQLPYSWKGQTLTTTGTYTHRVQFAGTTCDSIEHVLAFEVLPIATSETTEVACDTYTWNGNTYTASGDYTFTTTGANGCDSIATLHLTINHSVKTEETAVACDSYTWNGITYSKSGDYTYTTTAQNGCDSTITLHLTINQSVEAEVTEVACDSYTWNGKTYTTSGDYTFTTTAANGCDSTTTLHLTINHSVKTEETAEACDSYTWAANGQTYNASGDYTHTLQTIHGCDSTITLHLTINKSVEVEETIEACDSYTWNNITYQRSGDYVQRLTAANGCDSVVTLHLTIHKSVEVVTTETACDSYTWDVNGQTYSVSGTYTDTLQTLHGCDSIVVLRLTINKSVETEETAEACDSYTWNGKTYTTSGDYTYTTTAANGCDSTITLHLTINQSVKKEETAVACDSYTWNGKTYTTSGDYTFTTTAKNGCDSTATLHLTINNSVKTEETIEACDSYTWNGKTYTKSGDYTFTTTAKNGCDSTITLHLTINKSVEVIKRETACDSYYWNNTGKTYDQSGVYYDSLQTIHGCDSVIVLHLTINKSVETEETAVACDSYTWNGKTYTTSGDYTFTTTAANGCDSITTLHLTINNSVKTEETIEACDSYTWNGKTYTKSGDYTFTTTAKNGCDSTITLHLTINKSVEVIKRETACDSYYWNNTGITYDQSGVYYDSLQTIHGCDSVIVLHLTINKSVETEETVMACDSYTWKANGQTYIVSGDYTHTLQTIHGCDSVVTLHLTVNKSVEAEETIKACDSYTWNGKTYTKSGDYIFTTTAKNGCDSTITLHLTINKSIEVVIRETACDSYTWDVNGQTYSVSGTYTDTLQTSHGCDSIVVLRLTVNHSTAGEEAQTICYGDTYTWHGTVYNATGDYTYTLTNSVGCDSVATLHLTVMPKMIIDNQNVAICSSDLPYTWYGKQLTSKGTYTHREQFANVDCDSIEHILKLDVLPPTEYLPADKAMICWGETYTWATDGKVYDKSGTYTHVIKNFLGCDSLVYTLDLTELPAVVNKPVEKQYICWGETYTWHGKTYDETTTDTYVVENKLGCDSIIYTLNLTELPAVVNKPVETKYICHGDTYTWYGQKCNVEKIYTHVVKNILDCDSIIYTLDLKVLPPTEYLPADKAMICWGETYTWATDGKVYDKSGTYTHVIKNFLGCDSLVYTLDLTELPAVVNKPVEKQYICWGETYTWHGKTYDKTTTDTYVVENMLGCDSIIYTLNLIELPAVVNKPVETKYICHGDTYTWYGQKCNVEKTYTYVVKNILDCDSIIYTLDLKVLPPTEYLPADKAMICWGETYTWATDGKVYDRTGTYTHVIKNFLGCDSLVYTLDLTELPAVVNKPVEKQYICWGETYTWHGKTYDKTTTDTYVVKNMLGCDSIIYTLNLTELPAVVNKPVETKYICYGDTYTWHGIKCNVEKTYTYVVKNILDCDSIIYTLDLKVLPPTEYLPADKAMICWGETYTWATDGKVYDKSGTYTHVIKNFLGCDSLVYTLDLTELPAVVNKPVEKQYICHGDTYTWHGKTYDNTTTDTYVVKNVLGCDSIIYSLNLTELPEMTTENESIRVCPSELPYTWRGQQLTKSGTYTSYVPFAVNTTCDSIEYLLDFVVMEETKSEKTVTACDSYEWNGQLYTTSGRYTYSTTGANGCDSTAILYLTINRSTYSEEYVTVCYGETYEWNGMEYRQEGNYTVYLTNAAGCDSIAILHLTILPQMKNEYEELTVCPSDLPYLWHGQSLTKPGTYTDREQYTHYDCDRVEYHLTLKVYDFSAPAKVTMPRAICGNAVDVIAATEEIEAYIASRPSYAANATIGWQIKKNGTWATLTNEPVKGGVGEITLRYVIYSECGSLPSEEMVVPVEMPTPENDVDMNGISIQSRYNNRIFLFDLNAFNAKFGWKPEPAQVVWYKVVGAVDTYGEKGDDIKVGVGHSYNMPNGAVIEGAYYVLVERLEVSDGECEAAYRSIVISTVVGAQAPKLVPNAVRPSEMMTIKDLDPNQINEIYVYSTTGEMLATYTAEKVREFMLRASNTTGYYIIDVVNNDGKHTLKYIVK